MAWQDAIDWATGAFNQYGDDIGKIVSAAGGAYAGLQGDSDTVNKPYYYPGQEEGLAAAGDLARQAAEQGPNQYYGGSTVAPQDPNTISGQNEWLSRTGQFDQLGDYGANSALKLAGGGADRIGGFQLQDQVGFGIPQEYQNAIMNPIMNNLENRVIPGLHTQATQQGAFGGSRMQQQKADATSQATEAATDAMIQGNLQARGQSIGQRAGDISAQLQGRGQDITQNQLFNQALTSGQGALGQARTGMLASGDLQQRVGKDRTAYEQGQINADMDRFNWNRDEGENYINRLFERMQGMQPTGSVTQGRDGNWLDALSGGLQGLNIWNSTAGNTGTP